MIDPPVLQAPMAGFTNYAFRQIVREFGGAGLQATEMISARGFLGMQSHSDDLPDRLWGVADEPRPLAVQIWDNDPQALAAVGAKLAHELRVSVVDINFGCPVRQVTERAKSGSYLLRYPEKMGQIIESVVSAAHPTPVTAKIRLGCTRDSINAADVAQVVEGAGGAALTVHGRTAADFFKGSADWEKILGDPPVPQTDTADRQRRSRFTGRCPRGIPPLRHRRGDDRPGGPRAALALPSGASRLAGRADPR